MSTGPVSISHHGEDTWDAAQLTALHGRYSEDEYLALTDSTNRLIELVDGELDVQAMPTKSHQKMARFLCNQFLAFMEPRHLGDGVTAPYRIRLPNGTYREPDVVVYLQEHLKRFGERFGEGADLVVEVVSEGKDNRERDLGVKPKEYAEGGIQEYWIVDPEEQQVTVLVLCGGTYQEHGRFGVSDRASSALLPGFEIAVREVFGAGA